MFAVIELLHEAGCKTWYDFIEVLEDGEALQELGIRNESFVEAAHNFMMGLKGE